MLMIFTLTLAYVAGILIRPALARPARALGVCMKVPERPKNVTMGMDFLVSLSVLTNINSEL